MNTRSPTSLPRFSLTVSLLVVLPFSLSAKKGGNGGGNGGGGNGGGGDDPPPNPVIAYYNRADIGVMNADGSNRMTVVPRRTTLFSSGSPGPTPTWSPDGNRLAYFGKDRTLKIVALDGVQIGQPAAWIGWWDTYPVAWNDLGIVYASQPDASTDESDLFLVQPDGILGSALNLTNTLDRFEMNPSWVPTAVASYHTGYAAAVAFVEPRYGAGSGPDNLLLAGVQLDGTLDMANAVSIRDWLGALGVVLPEELTRVHWANLSNRFLLTHNDTVWVYDLDTFDVYAVATPPAAGNFEEGSWSPNDSQLAITGKESKFGKQSIYVVPSDGSSAPVAIGSGSHPQWWRNAP